jgi:hypothetical protein
LSEIVLLRNALSSKLIPDSTSSHEFLFISEPLFFRGERYSPSILTSLQKYAFNKSLSLAKRLGKSHISLRLHPREPLTNFSLFNQLADGKVRLFLNQEPIDILYARSGFCVGLTSALLFELYFAGYSAVSFAKRGWDCDLSFLRHYHMENGVWQSAINQSSVDRCQFRRSGLINDNYGRDLDFVLQAL